MLINNPLDWFKTRLRSNRPESLFKKNDALIDQSSSAVVFHWGDSATVDYFFRQPTVLGYPIISHVDTKQGVFEPVYDANQLLVVVRYLSERLLPLLEQHKRNGGKVVFFMDDDLPHNLFDAQLPRAYRSMLWHRFGRFLTQLEPLIDALWVSTPALAARYAHAQPIVLTPSGYGAEANTDLVSYFYHGNPSTHRQEIEWLHAVVANTQAQCADTLFMIMGDRQVRRLFSDVPRTIILHPMPWPTYRDTLSALPHHIGLAPLRPTKFNAHRSPTRFFDFARLGAVGLFCDVPPYRGFVRDGIDGWLLPSEPTTWSDKIIELTEDVDLRKRVLSAAQTRVATTPCSEE